MTAPAGTGDSTGTGTGDSAGTGDSTGTGTGDSAGTASTGGTDLAAFDARHVWHPYAPSGSSARVVLSARGVRLRLAAMPGGPVTAGSEPAAGGSGPRVGGSGPVAGGSGPVDVLDGMSSWWAAIHGYRHPVLDAALAGQAARMSHVMFGGLTHAPAVDLCRRLLDLAPSAGGRSMERVFLCDSGSVSVEVAVKLVLQYHRGRGAPGRTRFLTVRGGYHGDTFAAMSLCDPEGGMHSMFTGVLPRQLFADRPPAGFDLPDDDPRVLAWADGVYRLAEEHDAELAGLVAEPVLQGAGGMHVYSPACLRVLRAVADRHGVPLVLDEIATGFGRTGTMFGAGHAGVAPDVMCVGKALTGGYLSLAAVLCTGGIAAGVDASESGALMHGPTFMGNPLACAVALANLDLLVAEDWAGRVATVSGGLRDGLAGLAGAPGVRDVRVLGAVGAVQLTGPVDVAAATDAALAEGVWLRPFRDLIYTMPPYVCSVDEVAAITRGVRAAVHAVTR